MSTILEQLKKFGSNLKGYLKYIAGLKLGELLINFVILVILIVIASFVYIPVGVVFDLIRSLFNVFFVEHVVISSLYTWLIGLVSAVLAFAVFIYLFNNRCESMRENGEVDKSGKKVKVSSDEELELPKKK